MESLDAFVAKLNSQEAADSLVEVGAPAVAPLIWLLSHNGSTVHRRHAAYVLGRIGDRRAVEPLAQALRFDEVLVRENAAEALGRIGDPHAIRPLLHALGEATAVVRRRAAQALVAIGPPSIEPLIQEIWDPRPGIRQEVLETLAKIGAPAVAALIRTARYGKGQVQEDAFRVLGKIGGPHTLPRKVIAETRLTPQQRLEILKFLLAYHKLPSVRSFCQQALHEPNAAVKEGAYALLAELDRKILVRPSGPEGRESERELLRAAQNAGGAEAPHTLLRASESGGDPERRGRKTPKFLVHLFHRHP
jgi:HEAT repeat protein